jgi:hypothetical protein
MHQDKTLTRKRKTRTNLSRNKIKQKSYIPLEGDMYTSILDRNNDQRDMYLS